jgi:predicted aminopeptidase
MPRITKLLLSLSVCISLSACSQLSYYYQAAKGQAQLLNKRQPVEDLLAAASTPSKLKQQLTKSQKIRRFAVQHMGLKDHGGFTQYADLGRTHAVWNVVAAPEFSIEPRTWCFPIAGCVAYKGFFEQEMALREQEKLRSQGNDVLVYGVSAYSTLGWFDDPLLNTFIHYADTELAALIFHELSHQVLYIKDDSEFNEAFATAVEHAMLESWLRSQGNNDQIQQLANQRLRHGRITELILDFRQQLNSAYLGEQPAQDKVRLFEEMKRRYAEIQSQAEGTRYYDWWFSQPLNNAYLLTVSTYFRLVPAFRSMINQEGGDLLAFFESAKALSKKSKSERSLALENYLQPSS